MRRTLSPALRRGLGLVLSAALLAAYAQGLGLWGLGLVALLPWLHTLNQAPRLRSALWQGWVFSALLCAASLSWFGVAIGHYTQWGSGWGMLALLLAAPLLQPQVLVFALVRHVTRLRHGPTLGAWAAAAAWVGTEWAWPKLLGDTLGHGLAPALLLRQAADLGGAAGLTLMLLLCNEALAAAWAQRRAGAAQWLKPLGWAAFGPGVLTAYGAVVLMTWAPPPGPPLRMGLVQTNITDYETLREQQGSYAVVRQVLETHFAMSWDAVERQGAQAVLWTETAYPTTFGQAKSEVGAELDQEILATIKAAGVPFVLGTYERDEQGEYNAAAFVNPDTGLLGFYRKTRLFFLTETVPAWADGPLLQRWLPWAGRWQAGSGARVFPLRLKAGREIPVLPMICLDDVDTGLAIHGARQGAQALLTLSNDSWFNSAPQGAKLHQAVALFRSIETRLPQFRVTPSGHSAVIDPLGRIVTSAALGERALVVGEVAVGAAPPTLMVAWGDWVGGVCGLGLLLLGLATWRPWAVLPASPALPPQPMSALWRVGDPTPVRALKAVARLGAASLALAWLLLEPWRPRTGVQLQLFALLVLLPELCAGLWAWAARRAQGHTAAPPGPPAAAPPLWANPAYKFGLLPLALALPAFRLHQHIAFGGTFGEWHSLGPQAYLSTLGLWWASWLMGVVLCAALLRLLLEATLLALRWLRPQVAQHLRPALERLGLALLYLGLPLWLLFRTW